MPRAKINRNYRSCVISILGHGAPEVGAGWPRTLTGIQPPLKVTARGRRRRRQKGTVTCLRGLLGCVCGVSSRAHLHPGVGTEPSSEAVSPHVRPHHLSEHVNGRAGRAPLLAEASGKCLSFSALISASIYYKNASSGLSDLGKSVSAAILTPQPQFILVPIPSLSHTFSL